MNHIESPLLLNAGLNMLAVFDLESLPADILQSIQLDKIALDSYKQLLVFAHGGKDMWQALQQSTFLDDENPIDSFSIDTVKSWFEQEQNACRYHLLYPSPVRNIPLQALGKLAGWHHASPFRIGINAEYGSWYAYRVVVLADTALTPTTAMEAASPCLSCEDQVCIPACPANALQGGDLSLQQCMDYRLEHDSRCKSQCISRLACPVATEHRYSIEQINYHYDLSMKMIEQYQKP